MARSSDGDQRHTVRRSRQPDDVVLQVTRAEIVIPWVTARVMEDGIGYLRISSFPQSEALGQFDSAVAMLDGADIKALVIDVRGNPGGFYPTSVRTTSRFVRQGPILQRTPRQGQTETVNADGSAWARDLPIAVLVNSGTGSGGEVLPSALRENGIGYLIGVQTAGRLAGGQLFRLDDGSTLVIAVEAYRSGLGQEIEHVGLTPDELVELDPIALEDGRDSQLEAALVYLKTKFGSP